MDDFLTTIVAMKHCGRHTWKDMGEYLGWTANMVRGRYRRRSRKEFPKGFMPAPCPVCQAPSEKSKIWFEESDNYAEAGSVDTRIKTLQGLLEAAKVDLETWLIKDWGVKKWEVGAKIKEGHLEWEQGKIDGYLDYRGLGVQDLWSVWAKFIRKEPVFLLPTIQPIQCAISFPRIARPNKNGIKRALIGADAQVGFCLPRVQGELVPFHDRLAIDCFTQIAAHLQPDVIILLGDWNDLPEWTDKFVRSPEFKRLTQPALEEGHFIRRRLREACPDSRIEEHEGNHEVRMPNFVAGHLAAAANLKRADQLFNAPVLSIPFLLALDTLGIEWVDNYPNGMSWLYNGLRVEHGDVVSSVPGGTAKKILDDSEESVIFAHIHRRESASQTKRTRHGIRTIEARGIGCLCRIDGGVPARSDRNNWQQSVAVVDYTEDDHNIYDIEIKEGRAIWNGQIFQGKDYTENLTKSFPDWKW